VLIIEKITFLCTDDKDSSCENNIEKCILFLIIIIILL